MLTLEGLRAQLGRMPMSMRLGFAVLVVAIAIDVAAHVVEAAALGHAGEGHVHTPTQLAAHVGVLVGMVIVFAAVVVDGVRQSRARRSAAGHTSKGVA